MLTMFKLDSTGLPRSLYGGWEYKVGSLGLTLTTKVLEELHQFLRAYLNFCGYAEDGVYLRLDAFVDAGSGSLRILEINSRFVDGWGSALNLCRLTDILVDRKHLKFPRFWHLPESNKQYRAEFDLARAELALLGVATEEVERGHARPDSPIYYYAWGAQDRRPETGIFPAYGYELEDKTKLARFTRVWRGEIVTIPRCYIHPEDPWSSIPQAEVIFKFCEKGSPDAQTAGKSVMYARDIGKGKFARRCYERGTLIAQELVETVHHNGGLCQVIVMTCGAQPITGYVLWALEGTRVINDSSTHGPLKFDS